jgi:hypothetical protein
MGWFGFLGSFREWRINEKENLNKIGDVIWSEVPLGSS